MLSPSDVKKQLAYSTMGQMGFMIIQCSIGLYTAAIFHLIAHAGWTNQLYSDLCPHRA
jgi:NADH-quinone oxidoreductase subunit L